jgi:hypothetical protein
MFSLNQKMTSWHPFKSGEGHYQDGVVNVTSQAFLLVNMQSLVLHENGNGLDFKPNGMPKELRDGTTLDERGQPTWQEAVYHYKDTALKIVIH